jgi:hypothetical protein
MATSLELAKLYLAYFGRPPDASGAAFYANQTVAQVEAAFQASPEARQVYASSAGQADAAMVTTAYQHLFNRAPSAAEVQFWVGVGSSQGLSQPALAITLAASAQGSDNTAQTNRVAYVQQWVDTFTPLATSVHYDTAAALALATQQLAGITADPASLTTASTATSVTLNPPPDTTPPPPPPPPTVFTVGTDSFTTADNTLVYTATLGTGATLTANDSLHGAGNTLNITDTTIGSQDVLPSGLSLTGVSSLSLTTAGNAGTSASLLDPRITGLNSFTLHSSGSTNGEFLRGGTVALTLDSHAPTIQVLSGFGSLDITDNNLTGATALSLAGTGGAVTLHDPTGATALTIAMNALILTGGFTDADNHITSLTLAGTANLSTIDAITDTALASLSVTSGKVVLGSSATPIALGANVTTVNLSGGTDTTGTSYFTLGSNGVAFKVAADTTVIDPGAHTGLTVAFGSITSGLVNGGAGPIASGGHTGAAFITDLLMNHVNGPQDVEYGNDGTNTYMVLSDNGSLVQGNGFVRVVEIVGIHAVTVNGGNVSIS